MKNNKFFATALTVGFALFAMFFGAGNLILPPSMGFKMAGGWYLALLGFFLTGIIAPFLGVLTVSKMGVNFSDLGKRIHPLMLKVITVATILCIGPLVALPRIGATTYELGVSPIVSIDRLIFLIIFFGIALGLSISRNKIVDVIGKFLTPGLLISLLVLIIYGAISAPALDIPMVQAPFDTFIFGFKEGYQTLDVLASIIFASIIINSVMNKGYTERDEKVKVTFFSGIVSSFALLIIYGGLMYLGYAYSNILTPEMTRIDILLALSNQILGVSGTYVISIAISLACLTTSIALISSTGQIFESVSKGKLPYNIVCIACTILSVILAMSSVEDIISSAIGILLFVYPIILVIIMYILCFERFVKNSTPYIVGVIVTAIISVSPLLGLINSLLGGVGFLTSLIEQINKFTKALPLAQYDLQWFLPAIVVFGVVAIFKRSKVEE